MKTPPSLKQQALTPGILFFLPMMYIAWSDDVLTPSEIQLLETVVRKQFWLSKEDKQTICTLLNPQNPPAPPELQRWKGLIEASGKTLPESSRNNLMEVSRTLAGISQSDKEKVPAESALQEMEQALGIIGEEAVREIWRDPFHDPWPNDLPGSPQFSVEKLQELLDGAQKPMLDKARRLLSDPVFSYEKISPVKEEFRETVLEWCKMLADQGFGALSYPKEARGSGDMAKYIAVFEALGYHDLSLAIKFGVQFGLFGGSILGLGTQPHHLKYLPAAGSLELPGCFAMTEANHGSNVRDIETTAIYDPGSQEFIINTPHHDAHKEYIGNAAEHGQLATVFAQLITKGEHYGVHAILVPIRDKEGNVLPGVKIEDSGRKLGLNGVDNGRIWFDQVRVPRKNLLNRFADVSPEGDYSSPITSDSRRFFYDVEYIGRRAGLCTNGRT